MNDPNGPTGSYPHPGSTEQMYYGNGGENYYHYGSYNPPPSMNTYSSYTPEPYSMPTQHMLPPIQPQMSQPDYFQNESANRKRLSEGGDSGVPSPPKKIPRRKKSSSSSFVDCGGDLKFESLKDYIAHLMSFKNESFADTDFAERTLINLSRKLASSGGSFLVDWEMAIRTKDPGTPCVTVSRSKDSRMAVTRATGGIKKIYPQIIVNQIFRYPQLVFHNDIRSADECSYKAPVKGPEKTSEESSSGSSELVCINPYHFEMTIEAYSRLRRATETPKKKGPKGGTSVKKSNEPKKGKTSSKFVSRKIIDEADPKYRELWNKVISEEDEEDSGCGGEEEEEIRDFDEKTLLSEPKFSNLKGLIETKKVLKEPMDKEELFLMGVMDKLRLLISGKTPIPGAAEVPTLKDQIMSKPETEPPGEPSIKDLLEDIHGSFDQQFDGDFDDLGEVDTSDLSAFREPEELWTGPESWNSNSDARFLEAGSISQSEFDNFLPQNSSQENYEYPVSQSTHSVNSDFTSNF